MAFWTESRGIDEAVRKTDTTLNVLVAVLLAAFALAVSAYYYGQMNPRVTPATVQAPAAGPDTVQPGANPVQPSVPRQ
ncbi:hypothetical protein [Hyphomicrobium sp.]|uniref:hypothetical protein n=1 Tax=Hyphomicrobium sp. TaxID=82 RepID=UPI002D79FAD7|nr:hypothetical protein [Hyphomicrobium sp.]HET6390241.1 hypothetical protein [Hyphomicrobium sp.]